jgi:NAD+ kinase
MRLQFVSRIDDPPALQYTGSLAGRCEEMGHEVTYEVDTASAIGKGGGTRPGQDADCVVVIGGDGTILRTVQRMHPQRPILGINHGEVGFLADLEPEEAEKFLRSLAPGFPVETRMRILLAEGDAYLGEALNEALIVTSRPAKMLRFGVYIDGIRAERFRADGLLISTTTGSTAYAMSAGGPIVDPRIEGYLLVPLAPYLLSSRPHLISIDRTIEIRLESAKPAQLVIDGQAAITIGEQCSIAVRKSSEPAIFVDARRNFFEKVNRKLRHL